MLRKTLCLPLLAAASASTQAGEIYGGLGLPGALFGYAQPLDNRFTLRADYATLGLSGDQANEEGIDYQIDPSVRRLGFFGDWFATGGGFRLTGGITFNRISLDMTAQGNGQVINIGGTDYTTAADDRLDVKVEFPKVTPYIGVGYGHHKSSGFGFIFDAGASIGKAKVSAVGSGTNLGQVNQADLDAELAELRDGAGKVQFFPQISFGMTYRF